MTNATRRLLPISAALLAGLLLAGLPLRPARAQENAPPPPPPPGVDEGEAAPPAPDAEPPPADAEPPAQQVDKSTFEQRLAPYGRWVDTPQYGRVWVPAGVAPDWQPYTDGHWVDTDRGWSFASDAPWGWAVYHYGRWGFQDGLGWYWVPGVAWAPAWVSWRLYGGYVCWSPLGPPGFRYGNHWRGWVVVPERHFTHPVGSHYVPWARAAPIVRAARPVPGYAQPGRGLRPGPGFRPGPGAHGPMVGPGAHGHEPGHH